MLIAHGAGGVGEELGAKLPYEKVVNARLLVMRCKPTLLFSLRIVGTKRYHF